MNSDITDKIRKYIQSQSRNKIIFHTRELADLETINIGKLLSESIYHFEEQDKLPMRVSSELNALLDKSVAFHKLYGKYLSLENIGILFEQELKFNFVQLLENFSQNNALFIKWDGEIDADYIYFWTKEQGIKTNIKHLSHIAL